MGRFKVPPGPGWFSHIPQGACERYRVLGGSNSRLLSPPEVLLIGETLGAPFVGTFLNGGGRTTIFRGSPGTRRDLKRVLRDIGRGGF